MKFLIYYFLFLFFLLSIFISGVIDSSDSLQFLAVARNIYYKGKPTAPVDGNITGKNIHMRTYEGKDGDTYSETGLGFSLAFLPAVALTDLFYKHYGITPVLEQFPLENDWLIFLTASFINAFFGALLGVTLYKYLKELNLDPKSAFFISFISIFATNLSALSKHTWAHMMFIVFMMLSFLMLKLFLKIQKTKFLFLSGIFFGVMLIAYNPIAVLSVPPFIIYYFLLARKTYMKLKIKLIIKHIIYFLVGLAPFLLIFWWYENLRAWPMTNLNYLISNRMSPTIPVIYEALFGQLFSPGRSIFIYSPILLVIIFFWFKIKKNILPEFVVFSTFTAIYLFFYSLQSSYGGPDDGYTGLWNGESSWGPRYLSPLLPFGILLVGHIYISMKRNVKLFLFYPLLMIGIYISLLGIIMPYQIKYHDLEERFKVNSTTFTVYTYTNLIPRYSAILMMSKKMIKNIQAYPKTLDHGIYNVKLYDGINVPFNVGQERWRVIEGKGYISFDNSKKDPVKRMSFGLINHPITQASSSASVQFTLNDHQLLNAPSTFIPTERKIIEIPVDNRFLKEKGNQLKIDVTYNPPLKDISQIFSIIAFNINNTAVNLESLDLPYYSPLGPAMVGAKYNTYGGTITDPWRFWDLHTQIYERTPDFWWMRTFYYWDYPQRTLTSIFILTVVGMIVFGIKTFKYIKN